jgi:nucleotide-binding universal stress UspA family protein
MDGPIVAGADGSEASRRAIAEAGALAKQGGTAVLVVFVRHVRYGSTASAFAVGAVGPLQECVETDQTIAQAQAIAELDPLGIPWYFVVREGQPATELMKVATDHGADTIVVAGRRHGALGNLTHAAVTATLLHRWPHSLFVVRPPVLNAEQASRRSPTP